MLNLKLREVKARRASGEKGFTLIELLVVIIIIGILASIAIPIFMNQQKTARDAATTSDVKNVATNVHTGFVKYPDAKYIRLAGASVTNPQTGCLGMMCVSNSLQPNETQLKLWVGNSPTDNEVYLINITKGSVLTINGPSGATGTDVYITGYNMNGKSYTSPSKVVSYNTDHGGLNR